MKRHLTTLILAFFVACGGGEKPAPEAKLPAPDGQQEAPAETIAAPEENQAQIDQPNKAVRELELTHPDSVDYYPFVREAFGRFYGKDPWDTLLLERFSPIGWSADGKFSWLSEPPDVACGCYTGRLKVQSLVTDKIVWQHNHNSDGLAELRSAADYRKAGKAFWENQKSMMSEKFNELQVTVPARGGLLRFPLQFEGDELTVELTADRKKEGRMKGSVGRIQLKAISRKLGSKVILDESGGEDPYAWLLDVAVVGYMKSPLESRAVVLLMEVHRGFEGPPNVVMIRPIGLGLTKGFK